MSKVFFSITLLVACSRFATAANPLPVTYANTIDYISVNSSAGYAGCFSSGCGGEFLGTTQTTISGVAQPNSLATDFWCVDAQENFSFGSEGYADVIQLSQVASNPNDVRYSNVTNGGSPGWTNTKTPNGISNLPGTDTARYEMAAYLVQQYNGFSQSISSTGTCTNVGYGTDCGQRNDAIQQAIWDITSNSTYSADTTSVASSSQAAYWVGQALSNYSTVNTNAWAVVSWDANSTGGSLGAGPARQTFLIQIATPEPQFVALGLAPVFYFLVIFLRRRRVADPR